MIDNALGSLVTNARFARFKVADGGEGLDIKSVVTNKKSWTAD